MPPNPDKRQCTARTQAGARCRQWAIKDDESLHGPPVCSTHAGRRGHRLPNDEDAAAGRRCIATTRTGERCRRWALSGRPGRQPLCYTHAHLPPGEQGWPQEIEQRRCTATAAATSKRCRNWALRDSSAELGRPLCHAHAGRVAQTRRMPGPGERRCTALTRQGKRCRQWALRETAATGNALCAVHAAFGSSDVGHVKRRCTAIVGDGTGQRCQSWTLKAQGATLCWIHANPEQHGAIRHGFYRQAPPLSAEEQEAVALTWNQGHELAAAILIARLQILRLLAYLAQTERPLAQELNTIRLLLKGCRRVRRLTAAARQAPSTVETGRVPIAASEAVWLQKMFPESEWKDARGV